MIYFLANCAHAIRTIPVLQHDARRPEDVDTHMEDHAYDDCRYGVMSRPWVRKRPETKPKEIDTRLPTLAEMMAMEDRSTASCEARIG
jgi:hypothetical protein